MSDESGGDFGGGSVKWTIRYPKSTAGDVEHNVPVQGTQNKRKSSGQDGNATKFYIVLKNTADGTTLKAQLKAAHDALGSNPAQTVTMTLPAEAGDPQIRVLWEQPHGPGLTGSRSE